MQYYHFSQYSDPKAESSNSSLYQNIQEAYTGDAFLCTKEKIILPGAGEYKIGHPFLCQ